MDFFAYGLISLWLFWIVYWIASAWGTKRTAEPSNPVWRFVALGVPIAVYGVMRQFPEYFGQRLLPPSPTRAAIGLALTALGLGITIWARRVLGRNWSLDPTIKVDHELIRSGPYRFVRHPIYTGLLLAIFGGFLADAHLRDVYLFVLVVLMLVVKLKLEEGLMLRQFPQEYLDYRKRTKALVPFVF